MTSDVSDLSKRRRHKNRLIDRTAHRGNAACLIHGRSKDGKVEPLPASDLAIKDIPDMQTQIHVGQWLALGCAVLVQFGNPLPCRDCRAQCRVAGMHAVFSREDRKNAIADELEYV